MKKYLSNLFLFFVLFNCASSGASAANIPTCDDKKVLRWVEDIFYNKWNLPREKVMLQMEFLTETFSQPNERGCEVTVRSKLHPSGVKEMNGYLDSWNKETGASRPPSWLLNVSSESVNKFSFSLKHDLIKKEWYGQYRSPDLNTYTSLGSYRTALKGDLQVEIQKVKDRNARDQEKLDRIKKQNDEKQAIVNQEEAEKVAWAKKDEEIRAALSNRLGDKPICTSQDQLSIPSGSTLTVGNPTSVLISEISVLQQDAPKNSTSKKKVFAQGAPNSNLFQLDVVVKALVKDGRINNVTLISGNPQLFRIVEPAMLKYKCASLDFAVDVTQTFNFKK
jgi:hypothetical protein